MERAGRSGQLTRVKPFMNPFLPTNPRDMYPFFKALDPYPLTVRTSERNKIPLPRFTHSHLLYKLSHCGNIKSLSPSLPSKLCHFILTAWEPRPLGNPAPTGGTTLCRASEGGPCGAARTPQTDFPCVYLPH